MGNHEETARLRTVHLSTVRLSTAGCFCIAPLLFLMHRPAGGLIVFFVAAYLYAHLARLGAEDEDEDTDDENARREAFVGERLLKGLLGVGAVVLALFACYLLAIPHFPGGVRPCSNESAAIATLENLSTAQESFRRRRVLDHDLDGLGEFGSFRDLVAADPPELSRSFAKIRRMKDGSPAVERSGFCFQLHVIEPESAWCCYAWPVVLHNTGKRAFFVDQSGVARFSTNRRQHYNGRGTVPRFDAVLHDRGSWRELR